MHTIEEIAAKLDALNLWAKVSPYHWAIKPRGIAFPYFCGISVKEPHLVKVKLMLLEGWQTFHDFVRTRIDRDFGFYSSVAEMPHYELVYFENGQSVLLRCDTGFVPAKVEDAGRREWCQRMLWEVYGVMLRVEADPKLPLSFADEQAMFARVESVNGAWADSPLSIPSPRPHVERVSVPKDLLAKAKDLPIVKDLSLAVDMRLLSNVVTKEPRPRCAYQLSAAVVADGTKVALDRVSVAPDLGLRGVWEGMPAQLLRRVVDFGRIPGEIRVASQRVFRLLRPLMIELPFKLTLVNQLEAGGKTLL